MTDTQDWQGKGACQVQNPPPPLDIFFPENGRGGKGVKKGTDIYAVGKLFCRSFCKVRWQCLMFFLDEPDGVFGGTDPRQRTEIYTRVQIRTPAAVRGYVERNFDKSRDPR